MQHCDTVIAQHTTSKQELAPPNVVTAKIVSDHITLAASQADGWDVKFEGGNEVKLFNNESCYFIKIIIIIDSQREHHSSWRKHL